MNHALKGKALIIALAIYSPGVTRQSQDHDDRVYAAIDNANLDDEHKAEFYARLAEKLTPTTRLDQAEQIIEDALYETWSVTRG